MLVEKFIIDEKKSLIEAWKQLTINGKGIVFCVNAQGKLTGVLTDGDIRNFLISTENYNSIIQDVMNKKFVYAHDKEDKRAILAKMDYRIKIIPIVNDDFVPVDYLENNFDMHIPIAVPNLGGNEFKYLVDAFLSTWISSKGNYIKEFESGFAKFCFKDHEPYYGVAVANGTVALHLALVALGIGEGDEVIVPDLTFAATINTVIHAGATPVIVDIDKDSWSINPDEIEKAITPKTKAIIPVHVYGQPCDMDRIMEIARKNHLLVIEDCAEAHGAEYKNQRVGTFGNIGCFSFFANKVITTGEGGMCITSDPVLADKLRILRDHGMSKTKRYWHDFVGYNYRMTNLQAAIGLAQLERIDYILKEKENLENLYREKLRGNPLLEFQRNDFQDRKKITWMISVLYNGDKQKLMDSFTAKNIEVRPFFYPLSEMPIYQKFAKKCVVSKDISKRGINFPTNKIVNIELIDKIGECI